MKTILSVSIAALLGSLLLLTGCNGSNSNGNKGDCRIDVITNPGNTELTVNGKPTSHNISGLLPGEHLIVASSPGFQEARKTVNILEEGGHVSTTMQLREVRGLVLLHSDQPGADVDLPGIVRGTTPMMVPDCPLGTYKVNFSKTGYKGQSIQIDVNDRIPVRAFAALRSNAGTLEISSFPAAASVYVNDALKGQSPVTVNNMEAGRYEVRFEKEGYKPYKERVDVSPAETTPLNVTLTPEEGNLRVVSDPSEARIYLNGQLRGLTPFDIPNVKPGQHAVKVTKAGYEDVERSIVIGNGESVTEEFRMEKNAGKLIIVTSPADVEVLIDGEVRGRTRQRPGATDNISEPLTIELLPKGTHTLQLVREKYEYPKSDFEISGDQAVTINAELKRMFIKDIEIWTGLSSDNRWVGSLLEKHLNGDITVEIERGIIRRFRKSEIMKSLPYSKQ